VPCIAGVLRIGGVLRIRCHSEQQPHTAMRQGGARSFSGL
jgi:hypothetical protein